MAEDDRADDTRPQQQDNLPHAKDNEQQLTPPSTQPSSSSAATRTPRSLRSCNANKSKLIYDLKYHPMDESLHPSQAAKRRSAHGESYEADPEDSGSDGCPTGAESEDESDSESIVTVKEVSSRKMSGKGKKRTIEKVLKGEGTRRSARTTKAVNVLYDMSVHPQDSEIEVSSEEVSDGEGDEPVSKRSKVIVQTVRIDSESTQGEEEVEQLGSSEDKGVPCDVALNGRVNGKSIITVTQISQNS